ncbi:unnamed protein product, partial [Prorocentrum cordatum]
DIAASMTDQGLFSKDMFMTLSSHLRAWSSAILAAHCNQQDVVQDQLQDFVSWLDRCAASLVPEAFAKWSWSSRPGRGGHYNRVLDRRGGFNPHFLVQCLIFSFHARGTDNSGGANTFRSTIMQALRILPIALQDAAEQIMADNLLPSAATLSRSRLYLDVVWMLVHRDKHRSLIADDAAIYSMMDS